MRRELGIISIVSIFVLAGCQKMEPQAPDVRTEEEDNTIIFNVNQSNSWKNQETKSGDSMVLTTAGGEEMRLEVMTYEGIDDGMTADAGTKGAPISASNFELYDGQLALKAFWDESAFIDDILHIEETGWTAAKGKYYWPASKASIDFWAWAPAGTEYGTGSFRTPVIEDGTMKFSYGLQKHSENGDGFCDDAKHQPDLLYVRSLQHTKEDNGNTINLEFQHALAAVKFMIKTNSEGYVKSVSLLNVNSAGECVYTPAGVFGTGSFEWTGDGSSLKGEDGTVYTQSFNEETLSAGSAKIVTENNEGTVFMMIPQALGIQKIRIIYHENKFNRDMVFTGLIPGECWSAGKTYLYTLDYKTFSISVSDKVTGNVKSNVIIRNTGSTTAFIRATLVGYWAKEGKNGNRIIVAPWDMSKGKFEGLAAKNWIREGGYFYYTEAVPGGSTIPDGLFSSYTYSEAAPVAGAKLYIMVSAQAVEYDAARQKVSDAWGAGIASNLHTL